MSVLARILHLASMCRSHSQSGSRALTPEKRSGRSRSSWRNDVADERLTNHCNVCGERLCYHCPECGADVTVGHTLDCDSDPKAVVVANRTAEKIATWLEARGRFAEESGRREGNGRGEHARAITDAIAAAVRAGDWR